MDRYSPIRSFIGKLCTEGSPLNQSKRTRHWNMDARSNTRDWTCFDIHDEEGNLVLSGNFDFWTKTLVVVESHSPKTEEAVISAFRAVYPEDFSVRREKRRRLTDI